MKEKSDIGLPQGLILDPLLFIVYIYIYIYTYIYIYINDIDGGITSKILKFAYNTKIIGRTHIAAILGLLRHVNADMLKLSLHLFIYNHDNWPDARQVADCENGIAIIIHDKKWMLNSLECIRVY